MTDKERETPNWNPPEPPWNPEPSPLRVGDDPEPEPEVEPEPVNTGLEDKIEEMVESGELELEGTEEPSPEETIDPPGLMEYTVLCPTGITINGKVYEGGPHSVDEETYETLSQLDAPYQ